MLPYFWMVVISFSARSGGVASDVLWTACAVIVPAVAVSIAACMSRSASRGLRVGRRWCSLALRQRCSRRSSGRTCTCDNYQLPVARRHHRGRPLEGDVGEPVPVRLDRLPQLARAGAVADRHHPGGGVARRLLHVALRLPRAATTFLQGPAGAARLPGDDADHPDLPDADWTACSTRSSASCWSSPPSSCRSTIFVHEGILRRRALGHRDERHDRRRDAAAGLPAGGAAAGPRGPDRRRRLRVHPRLGGIHLRRARCSSRTRTG